MGQIFTSNVPKKVEALSAYLAGIINQLAEAIYKPRCQYIDLEVLHKEPTKIKNGRVVIADGTDWNPGSGLGMYRYEDGTGWVKIG